MSSPIVIAHHLIFTAYGWWLPNDPRGSMSRTTECDVVAELGELHYGRKKVQPASRDLRAFYSEAAAVLKHDLLEFNDGDIEIIASAIAEVMNSRTYTCWACAIMPDHVHLLARRHRDQAEEMINACPARSHERLRDCGARDSLHPVWGGPGWKIFLDHPLEVRRVIQYIEGNPRKIGRSVQHWSFVKEYDNWPLHPGHSPNSPYAKRLRAAGRYP